MSEGHPKVEGTVLGFLIVGLSWQHLWFLPRDKAQQKKKVIESGTSKQAYECSKCKTMVIAD
jgi:hypothetical protein